MIVDAMVVSGMIGFSFGYLVCMILMQWRDNDGEE